MRTKTGAGVIPFAIRDGLHCFLFHKTFSGRRAGLLVDFGGGSRVGESHVQTAAREFVEETEAMFFAEHGRGDLETLFQSQYRRMLHLIEQTQRRNPDWWCGRRNRSGDRPRDWKTFFVEVEYRDPTGMNRAWAEDSDGRFKKRRELVWLTAEELLDVIDNRPEALWKRIRAYDKLRDVILAITCGQAYGE
jgi:8-oxo-dGTP pyrophosphatase MutT (NUDIX family)